LTADARDVPTPLNWARMLVLLSVHSAQQASFCPRRLSSEMLTGTATTTPALATPSLRAL